jgi:hypothetical protein
VGSRLDVVAVTAIQDGGQALYTIRSGDGAWRGFVDVVDLATTGNGLHNQGCQPHNVSVAFCNDGLDTQDYRLYLMVGALYPETLGYTIHSNHSIAGPGLPQGHPDSTWKPWSDLLDECGGGAGALRQRGLDLQCGKGRAPVKTSRVSLTRVWIDSVPPLLALELGSGTPRATA